MIHVGANTGQERDLYARHGLKVLWLEPIPDVFLTLQHNIKDHDDQAAIQCLLTDRADSEYEFHVATNDGASSSMLDFRQHRDMWPDVDYCRAIAMRSTTPDASLEQQRIAVADHDALVMDTQGSELLVLPGAQRNLHSFCYVKVEVPDFES